jgi:hypothetical protein
VSNGWRSSHETGYPRATVAATSRTLENVDSSTIAAGFAGPAANIAATPPPRLRPYNTTRSGAKPPGPVAHAHAASASSPSPTSLGCPSEPGYPRYDSVNTSKPLCRNSRCSARLSDNTSPLPPKYTISRGA